MNNRSNTTNQVMRAMLSKMGYFEVVTAEDGEQVANPILSHE